MLEYEVLVAASPETVFGYFTDPSKLVAWMGDEATLDPRPGGVCRISWTGEGVVAGEYVEVVPYSRVVFTWGWEGPASSVGPSSTLVEVDLTPTTEGTRVRLAHRRLPERSVEFHTMGWTHYLPRLAIAAPGGEPGPDPRPGAAAAGEE